MGRKTIAGRYVIEDELGSGGMGTVFKATDTATNQTVAIKQLHTHLADLAQIERFKREGEALRDLNHPNIVKILDAIEEAGNHYLVMEYVGGGDLKALIEHNGKLDHQRCIDLAIDLADALTRAHRLNIIHRDLKPANVLIGDGMLRLTDFGVAHVVNKERVTDSNAVIGTIDYLSPETLNGEPIDTRVDIWALGVMLFEMLTGQHPFRGDSIGATVTAILTAPVPDLETLLPSVPIALIDLVYRMLDREPSERISSVRHVGAALEDLLHGRSVHTPVESRFATPLPDAFERPKHNLPAQTTAFVGRESELSELARLLDNPQIRLVSIVAPGGMGKTRLSLQAAELQLDNFDNGVYFVELAPLSDPNNIVSAIANATGYQFQSDGREQKQQLLDFLANKDKLLVLDNFEHLLAGASLVTEILNAAPNVQILVTSRQRLNQSGETIFTLSGMDLPIRENPQEALEHATVKLFMQSARRVQPQFELTVANMKYVARICILVQGMPLGIILAASWLSMLSVEEISIEMSQKMDFLESDISDLPERHRSIRAIFSHSWDMLSEAERDVYMKLSVFKGGLTREAAQTVSGVNLRTLMSLMNKSLIQRDADTGRFSIHEFLRQYAEEQLLASGEAPTVYEAHASYFADFMDSRWVHMKGRRQNIALNEIEVDIDNVRAAWYYWTDQANVQRIKQFLHSIWMVYDLHGWYQAGIGLFTLGCKAVENTQTAEAQAVWGWVLVARGMCEAISTDFPHAQGTGLATDVWVQSANTTFPTVIGDQGRSGFQLVQQGIGILRQLKSYQDMLIVPLISTSIVASWANEQELALTSAQSCLEIATATNDVWGIARAKQLLTVNAMQGRRYEDAEQLALSALDIFEQLGDNWSKSVLCIEVLGTLALDLRRFDAADEWIKTGLEAAKKVGFHYSIRMAHWQLGYAAALQEKYLEAGKYWQVAVTMDEQGLSGSSVFVSGSVDSGGDGHDHQHHEH